MIGEAGTLYLEHGLVILAQLIKHKLIKDHSLISLLLSVPFSLGEQEQPTELVPKPVATLQQDTSPVLQTQSLPVNNRRRCERSVAVPGL